MIHTELMSASWRRRKGGFNESFPGLLEIIRIPGEGLGLDS